MEHTGFPYQILNNEAAVTQPAVEPSPSSELGRPFTPPEVAAASAPSPMSAETTSVSPQKTQQSESPRPLGFEISSGKVAITEVFADYGTLHAPFEEVIERHKTMVELKPQTADRIYHQELLDDVKHLQNWVSPQIVEGLKRRVDNGITRWDEFSKTIDMSSDAWRDDQAKNEKFIRLGAWAVQLQNDIAEVRTNLAFLAGIRTW